MRKLVLMSLTLLLASCARSNDPTPRQADVVASAKQATPIVIELRVADENAAPRQPASSGTTPATVSIEAQVDKPFAGSAKGGDGGTIAVDGSLHALSSGKYRVRLRYANQSPTSHRSFQTTLELAIGEEHPLSGVVAGGGEEIVVLRLAQAR